VKEEKKRSEIKQVFDRVKRQKWDEYRVRGSFRARILCLRGAGLEAMELIPGTEIPAHLTQEFFRMVLDDPE
jgi:hypothetical protein